MSSSLLFLSLSLSFIILSFLISISISLPITIYVNNQSLNTNTTCGIDNSTVNACSDISSALIAFNSNAGSIVDGVTQDLNIVMSAGTYLGDNNANFTIYNQSVSIEADNIGTVTIDMSNTTATYFIQVSVNQSLPEDMTEIVLSRLSFTGLDLSRSNTTSGGILVSTTVSTEVLVNFVQCQFTNIFTANSALISLQSMLAVNQYLLIDQCIMTNVSSNEVIIAPQNVGFNLTNSQFTANNGIFLVQHMWGLPIIVNNTFSNNNFTNLSAGALFLFGYITSPTSQIANNTFTSNQVYGAIIMSVRSRLFVSNCLFTKAINTNGIIVGDGSVLYLSNSSFISNSALKYGQIYATDTSSIVISNSSFVGNSAINGSAISALATSSFAIDSTYFTENVATGSGGAINSKATTQFTITNSKFSNNSANNVGGAIFSSSSSYFNISTSVFNGNSAGSGGAIECNNSTIVAQNVLFDENIDKNSNETSDLVSCENNNCKVSGNSNHNYCLANNGDDNGYGDGLPKKVVVGIIIGVVVGVLILALIVYIIYKRRKNQLKYATNYHYSNVH
ncbi:hypothetical protein DFA_02297 [Cavenderia fasciculata]|uniref:Right handed beta helix domain-containing protein n=1 Tax=Cavenderia fasciculata TaxID=261658 RepID=F4PZ24_CACFS|nr:uncharacterized protein DFA_02297 [Cavenderia fasciculata]EGG19053.1 hypothetical protein DFA_02297 [Cavenderia fasciculata]|eukprot:XP_004366686.1 hypothetical protein DFA_02297 [Cavenderia fasciculata]